MLKLGRLDLSTIKFYLSVLEKECSKPRRALVLGHKEAFIASCRHVLRRMEVCFICIATGRTPRLSIIYY